MMNVNAASFYITNRLKKELPKSIFYHDLDHTLEVVHDALFLCKEEKINPYETALVKTAAYFHDAGFIYTYKDHEKKGVEVAQQILPQFGYDHESINIISSLILATQMPQKPKNNLEKIICDADLYYLGGLDYFNTADRLYHEWKVLGMINTREEWLNLQKGFLNNHNYHTDTARYFRNKGKQAVIQLLEKQTQ